ncbi:MAG: acyl-ACP--UDP-N-acetylglucosamine O-acyltransferase [Bdellovibrionales bacterium]
MSIHPTAIIGKDVELASDVSVGAFSVLQGRVRIDQGTKIESHTVIGNPFGIVEIGKNNQILSGAMIGGPPQDLSYTGQVTRLTIGDNNILREFTTLNCGTVKGGLETKIGNHCMLMAYVHIAHDCQLADHVVVANTTQFAGHVIVEDHVRIGGMVGIAQFSRLGRFAYIGGGATINKDIPPFTIADGNWARIRATNKIGITRAGFDKEDVSSIYRAIRFLIMGDRTVAASIAKIKEECKPSEHINHLIQFIETSEIGIAI